MKFLKMKMTNRSKTRLSSDRRIRHNHFLLFPNIFFCYRTISERSFQEKFLKRSSTEKQVNFFDLSHGNVYTEKD